MKTPPLPDTIAAQFAVRGCRILLVEDNADDAFLIQGYLSQYTTVYTYVFSVVERLVAALYLLETEVFDIILLDLTLPDSSGSDTLMAIHEKAPRLPIVVLTGMSDEALALTALQMGAQDYLIKDDIDGVTLSKAIRYSIERNLLLTQLKESKKEREELEIALKTQKQMRGWEKGEIAASIAGVGPLRNREPELFAKLKIEYGLILKNYLQALLYKDSLPRPEIDRLASRIGQVDGGPRDIVDMHLSVIEEQTKQASPQKTKSYTVDGRLFTIEIMGMLVDYYRLY